MANNLQYLLRQICMVNCRWAAMFGWHGAGYEIIQEALREPLPELYLTQKSIVMRLKGGQWGYEDGKVAYSGLSPEQIALELKKGIPITLEKMKGKYLNHFHSYCGNVPIEVLESILNQMEKFV